MKVLIDTICKASNEYPNIISVYGSFLVSLQEYGFSLPKLLYSSALLQPDHLFQHEVSGVTMINRLLNLVSAETYLAAHNTIFYAKRNDYEVKNVLIQDFRGREYSQVQKIKSRNISIGFIQNLSCLDALSFLNPTEILSYLDESNNWSSI
jgi:hypothetical protein